MCVAVVVVEVMMVASANQSEWHNIVVEWPNEPFLQSIKHKEPQR